VSFAEITTYLSAFGNRFKSAKRSKNIATLRNDFCARREVSRSRLTKPELYFYQGKFISKVAAQDFAHDFIRA
jgi:hypothetical protein